MASRFEMTEMPSRAKSSAGLSSTQDQRRAMRAPGLVMRAPRAKAFMLAGTPRMG